jgi:hemin uptake protein HemP
MIDHESADDKSLGEPADDHIADSIEPAPRTINSVDLLHGAREILIQHDEKTYRLRVTRNGKLILIK